MVPGTLVELLRSRTTSVLPVGFRYLERGDVEGPSTSMSWAEVDRRARAVGARLQALGHSGERILLLFPPGLDFIVGFFGALYAGSIAVPAYPPDPTRLQATLPRLRMIVRDARPSAVLTTQLVQQLAEGLASMAPEIAVLETIATDDLEPGWEQDWTDPKVGPDTLAFLQYTSGSTGAPRGVCLTHRQLLANQEMIRSRFSIPGNSAVSWLPLFHDMGLIGTVIQPLYQDAPVTLMSPLDFLKRPMSWLVAISKLRAPISGGPDFAYALCARKAQPRDLEGLDLSCWKLAFSGAEPVRAETLEAFARVFGDVGFDPRAFYPTYGLAEATLFVSGGVVGTGARTLSVDARSLREGRVVPGTDQRLVSCGPAAPGNELAILRADGTRAGPDEVGEIYVSGPAVADGYWDAPGPTAETFVTTPSGRRWLKTGDLGLLHDGELYVAGRSKDLIIVRGRNHYPQDIERTVEEAHEAVRPGGVAAFSIPGADGEGLGLAVEVPPEADPVAIERSIRAAVAARHEVAIEGLALVPPRSLPKTSSGKIQRHAARKAWMEDGLGHHHRVGAAAPMPGGLPEWLVRWLEVEAKVPRNLLQAGATLSELGLDSLALVQLAGAMEERLGTEVPVEVVFGRTLGEVADWVQTAGLPTSALERPDLIAASRLDDAIAVHGQVTGQALLLTGATGFLGSHLLAELQRRWPGPIVCLVRAAGPEAGKQRVMDIAARLGTAIDPERLEVICGDLTRPRLGLDEPSFLALARRLARIVHCGAVVDWSATFAQLLDCNVGGTHEVVRLAALGGGVPIHHVSSLGVFPMGLSRRDAFEEQEDVSEGELLRVSYFQSKWAAERVLEAARDRGVPVTIYRPGFIAGHSQTGAELEPGQQLLCAFLCGALRMGQAPSVDKVVDVLPVDFVAGAIGAMACRDDLAGRKLALLNPSPMRQSELYEALAARGHALQIMAYPRWRQEVLSLSRVDPDNPLAVFALYYRAVTPSVMRRLEVLMAERMPIGDDLARAILREEGITCPPFDRRLLEVYLDRYQAEGLLPAPSAPRSPRVEPQVRGEVHAPVELSLEQLARPWLPELGEDDTRLLRLYEKAKAQQWDASKRIDWSMAVDPEDPQGLGDEAVPLWGSALWGRLSQAERVRVRVHHQGWQISQFLVGEQGALLCASRLVQQAPTATARMACATQVMDEMRHVEVFSRLLHEKIGAPYQVSPPLRRLLDDVLYDRRWDVTCLGMQVLIEGLALAVFSMMRDRSTHPLIAAVHRYVIEDEVRHVGFGKLMLEARNRDLTEAERREREEFVIEASYLLRDRFAALDLWEQLDLPVAECAAWIEESGAMRHYRRELFRKIVPVVRGIGLWSSRVREAYAKMGVLSFATETLEDAGAA